MLTVGRTLAPRPEPPIATYLVDNAVAFWHRFVVPQRSRLSRGDPREVWSHAIEPYLNDWLGPIFEKMAEQAYRRYHVAWGLPGARTWASWVGRDRNARDIQIDIVAELDDGTMLTGEIKWSSHPRGFELSNDLLRNLDDLGHAGHGWARAAANGTFLFVSAGGFTNRFREWATDQPRVKLITLDDMFA